MADFELDVGLSEVSKEKLKSEIDSLLKGITSKKHNINIHINESEITKANSKLAELVKNLEKIQSLSSTKIKVNTNELKGYTNSDNSSKVAKSASSQNSKLTRLFKEYQKTRAIMAEEDFKGNAKPNSESQTYLTAAKQNLKLKEDLRNFFIDSSTKLDKDQASFLKSINDSTSRYIDQRKAKYADANAAMTQDTRAFQLALQSVDSTLARTEKNLRNWSKAKNGKSSGVYSKDDFAFQSKEKINNIAALNRQIIDANENTQSFSAKFATLATKFSQWFSVSQLVMKGVKTFKEMYQNVKEIDAAMTELKKVTNETDYVYTKFLDGAATRSKNLGATLTDTITATADYARLGYSIEDASKLADASIIYKNVGDGINDISTASESIISTMKAFNIEADDSLSIVDRFNEVGNNFAISSSGIGQALLNSASALATGNNSLDESIGLITAANSVVQDPSKVGTALKTISMYLRAAKTEAEDAGESTDGMAESVSKLRADILKLTGNKVDIQIDENTFKSTYQILKDLSTVWNDLSDLTKANIIEKIGGKRNANVVTSILGNFDIAEDVMKTTADSFGSATKENDKYLNSIEGRISQLKAEFEDYSQSVVNSDLIKGFVKSGTTILDIFTKINKTFGTLVPAATAVAAAFSGLKVLKGEGGRFVMSDVGSGAQLLYKGMSFDELRQKKIDNNSLFGRWWYKDGARGQQFVKERIFGIERDPAAEFKSTIDAIDQYQETINGTSKKYGSDLKYFSDDVAKSNKALKDYFASLRGGEASLEGYHKWCKENGIAVQEMGERSAEAAGKMAGVMNVLSSVGKAFLISAALTIVAKVYDSIAHSAEKMAQKVSEANDAYKEGISKANEASKVVDDISTRYEYLSKGVNTATNENKTLNAEEYEEYLNIVGQISETFPDLIQGYDSQGNAILSCAGNVDKLTEAYKNLRKNVNGELLNSINDTIVDFGNKANALGASSHMNGSWVSESINYLKEMFVAPFTGKYNENIISYRTYTPLQKLIRADDVDEAAKQVAEYFSQTSNDSRFGEDLAKQKSFFKIFEKYGIDTTELKKGYKNVISSNTKYFARIAKENKNELTQLVDDYESNFEKSIDPLKNMIAAYVDNIFLDDTKFSNISSESESILNSYFSKLGFQDLRFKDGWEGSNGVKKMIDDILSEFNDLSSFDQKSISTFLDIKAKYNNGACSIEEYQKALSEAEVAIDNIGDKDVQTKISTFLNLDYSDSKIKEDSAKQLVRDYEQAGNIGNKDLRAKYFNEIAIKAEEAQMKVRDFINTFSTIKTAADVANSVNFDLGKYFFVDDLSQTLQRVLPISKDFKAPHYLKSVIDTETNSFTKNIDDYLSKTNVLKSAFSKLNNGTFRAKDLEELNRLFPALSEGSDDLRVKIVKLAGEMGTDLAHRFGEIDTNADVNELNAFRDAVLELGDVVGDTSFSVDISAEIANMEAISTAINESVSSIGVQAESLKKVKEIFSTLPGGYDANRLFEGTVNGIHLNTQALRELNKEYIEEQKAKQRFSLQELINDYKILTEKINQCSSASESSSLFTKRNNIEAEIKALSEEIAIYDGLTSAFHRWEEAQQTGNERDMYESIAKGKKQIDELIGRGWVDDEVRAYIDLLSGKDLSTAPIKDVIAEYNRLKKTVKGTGYDVFDFFTLDDDGNSTANGVTNFFNALMKTAENKKNQWVTKNKEGLFSFNFDNDGGEGIAKALGLDIEAVQAILRAAIDTGFEVNFDSVYQNLDLVKTEAEKAADAIRSISKFDFNFKGELSLKDTDVKNTVKVLETLIAQKLKLTEPAVMSIDVSKITNKDARNSIEKVQQYIAARNDFEIKMQVGVDSNATKNAKDKLDKLRKELINNKEFIAYVEPHLKPGETIEGLTEAELNSYINDLYGVNLNVDDLKINKEALKMDPDAGQTAGAQLVEGINEALNNIDPIELKIAFPENMSGTLAKLFGLEKDKETGNWVYKIGVQTGTQGSINNSNDSNKSEPNKSKNDSKKDDVGNTYNAPNYGGTFKGGNLGGTFKGGNYYKGETKGETITDIHLTKYKSENVEGTINDAQKVAKADDEVPNEHTIKYYTTGGQSVRTDANKTGYSISGVPDDKIIKFSQRGAEALQTSADSVSTKLDNVPESKFVSIFLSVKEKVTKAASRILAKLGISLASGTVKNTVVTTSTTSGAPANRMKMVRMAKAQGTAFKSGNWGTKSDGVALGGELGQELVVRDGRFFTIGDDSAEFFKYKRGDIIFNAEQTSEIFRFGKIKNAKARGQALSSGNAFVEGNAFNKGANGSQGIKLTTIKASGSTSKTSKSSKKSSSKNSDSSKEDSKSKIDYIEIAIDRLERAVKKLERVATSSFKTLDKRLKATTDEFAKLNEEASTYQKAYNKYLSAANAVNVSSSIKKKVQNGSIDITEYSSETADLINEYKSLYEKALDAKDAIEEIRETQASLYENKFNDMMEDYESQLNQFEHQANIYNSAIETSAAKGYLASTKYYEALIENEYKNIDVLQKEMNKLIQARDVAVSSGYIEKYSQSWYKMQDSINGVEEAINDANKSLVEFKNNIRDTRWENFAFLQDEISQITSESNFLIDLMSDSKLFDDKGTITDSGMATMGLRAMNYDVYMAQADKYAREIQEVNKELTSDENKKNTNLIKKREELLELQRESILSAENEKGAIKDLVSSGIDLQISSLQKLINKYNDSLDSAKDLYDYQKRLKDSTSEIASLQKQLAAYQNDTSEETKATVQRLKVELQKSQENLQDTEYDRYISEQKKLLDHLFNEYEDLLNQRLDNIELLLSDAITMANDNTYSINETIETATQDVGYTLTDELSNVWNGTIVSLEGTLSEYGDNFAEKLTTINAVLDSISSNVGSMVAESNAKATATTGKSSSTSQSKTASSTTPKATTTTTKTSTTTSKAIKVGGTINAGNAKIYKSSDGKGASTQYYKKDPIYTVIRENNGYVLVRHHTLKKGSTGWFKKSDVKAYKHGGLAKETGFAWLDGTPQKPEAVLSATDTNNLLRLTDMLDKINRLNNTDTYSRMLPTIISDVSETNKKILGSINTASGNQGFRDAIVNIGIEHVEDYNDFMRQLTQDNNFIKFVQSFTIDRVAGGSPLSKNKYRW